MEVVIAGAGIGGLMAGLCCLQKGFAVKIYEKATALTEVGAGIQISPNAMRVFQRLGLADRIIARGFLPEKFETRMGKNGRSLFAINAQGWDAPYVHIHRADLIDILSNAFQQLNPNGLETGMAVTSFTQKEDHVTVTLNHSEDVIGNYLIGADGIHSPIRRLLFGTDNPRFTGNIAWRAVVPTDSLGSTAPDPNATVWMGHKRHCVTYRIRRGELINFVGVVETQTAGDENWTSQGKLKDLKSDFKNWHPIIANLIANIDERHLYRWALYDRDPMEKWAEKNVALLGDAAHAVLPFMAQGAAMAIEDSWALANAISNNNLDAYQKTRIQRTTKILKKSRSNMKTFHRANGPGLLTYIPMWLGGTLAPGLIKSHFNWIYEYDITSD